MNSTRKESRVTILVKALPRPSSGHSETVCCAGVTSAGEWKRLYPIRYRHGGETFDRWDNVSFSYVANPHDKRAESCKVLQGTLTNHGPCRPSDKQALIEPLITPTLEAAAALGRSLTAIRPTSLRFKYRRKRPQIIAAEKAAYVTAARQVNMLDKDVQAFEPTPFALSFAFTDQEGNTHTHQCGDWETHATFYKWSKDYGEEDALRRLTEKYEKEYMDKGVVLVLGTIAKRPRQWTLLGIVRLDKGSYQTGFAF
ncbi:hypothetical protein SMB554_16115 [Sinorhizobium meliloti]|uniref:hypothetical protein n=1 Tax=Rhizobium meliloti TaxID=382 RepID=UPI000B6113E9|nr:hypothetical protein [Sinorhizobium meliloti]ASJ60580.1 hypothetical protein SMB554_16115 [Sinorhizobium meliloti]MCK3781791.1 hypothetical protein [Sinorhizobium meliloti]MCK3789582.1 hypothetical protein [Sinorhizobium meliloti]MCK3796521.1 hypothetical protein [Sinorhizobium meliloti]MDW9645865.1 hypothetical protein [Sinorhizobium meliloti]